MKFSSRIALAASKIQTLFGNVVYVFQSSLLSVIQSDIASVIAKLCIL